jgi:hypothetical protein
MTGGWSIGADLQETEAGAWTRISMVSEKKIRAAGA